MKYIYLALLLVLNLSFSFAQHEAQSIEQYRTQQLAHLKKSAKGPIADEFLDQVHYYAPNDNFKINAQVVFLTNEPTFRMPTLDGTNKAFRRYALLNFTLNGQPLTLTAYESVNSFQASADNVYLFLPFMDLTTGEETYESGRYLDFKKQDINGEKVTLDFNKAYNPYCAYSSGYRCPQPPAENFLNVEIAAGEKKYTGPKNHKEQDNTMAKNFSEKEKKRILSGAKDEKMYVLQTTVEADSLILRASSEEIKFDDPLLPTLAARMFATVQDPEHAGVGIAAPQVGINKALIWVQRFDQPSQPFEYYINPKITWRSQLLRKGTEGCLSIPDQRDEVLRSYAIKLQYTSKEGKTTEELIEGFTAVIFQHEVDHLYGILFPDRLTEQADKENIPLTEKIEFSIIKGTLAP